MDWIEDDLQARRQNARAVDRLNEFLQRGDQGAFFVDHRAQACAGDLRASQGNGLAVYHPLDGKGAQRLGDAGDLPVDGDFLLVQRLGIEAAEGVDQHIDHAAIAAGGLGHRDRR